MNLQITADEGSDPQTYSWTCWLCPTMGVDTSDRRVVRLGKQHFAVFHPDAAPEIEGP